jgi:methionine-rich copper-binding protein CopC
MKIVSFKEEAYLCAIILLTQVLITSAQAVGGNETQKPQDMGIQTPSITGNNTISGGIISPQSDYLVPIWYRIWNSITENHVYSILSDGFNIYIVGSSESGNYGIYLSKYDLDGNLLWNKVWESYNHDGTSNDIWAYSAALHGSYLYVVGIIQRYGMNNSDAILIKFDLDGNYFWIRAWGNENDDSSNSISIDNFNIYVGGSTTNNSLNSVDIFILKYDLNGGLLFEKIWDSGSFDLAKSITSVSSNLYVCGYTSTNGSNKIDALLLKYDLIGNLIWSKTWGGNENDWANSIAADSSNVYIAGQTDSYGNGLDDVFILKYDLNGNLVWNTTWGGKDSESANSIAVDDSNIYTIGWTDSYGSGTVDAFVLKHDLNGNMLWNKTWGSEKREWAESIAIENSYLYLAGEKDKKDKDYIELFVLKCDLNGGDSTYPFVVNTIPMNGSTNISTNTNILITFSEAMNTTATEGAISSSPAISGTFAWDTSGRTLTWNPNSDLQANTDYTIVISTSAKSQRNITMQEPFVFLFTTFSLPDVYPPYVISTYPVNGSMNVFPATRIAIQWNESMNRLSAENAFSSSPLISCRWSWSVVTQICNPTSPLQFNTKYTITINASAKDIADNSMKNRYLFLFTTKPSDPVPLVVMNTQPKNNSVDIPMNISIMITFSQEMNRSATEGAITASPSIIGIFTWNATSKTVTWDPSMDLQADTTYSIMIGTKAISKAGLHLPTSYTFSFTTSSIQDITPPHVVSTYPANNENDVDIGTKILIIFSEPMNETATAAAVSISLGSIANKSWGNDSKILTMTATLEEGKTYIVTISADAKDIAGNTMTSSYNFSFTTKNGPLVSENMTMLLGLIILIVIIATILLLVMLRIKRKEQASKKLQLKPTETKEEELEEIKKEPEEAKKKPTKSRKVAIESINKRREQAKKSEYIKRLVQFYMPV